MEVQDWQGIIPGKTSKEETLLFLKESPYVRRASIYTQTTEFPIGTRVETIIWDNETFNILTFAIPSSNNRLILIEDKVRLIDIKLDHVDITVDQVIAHFGEPEKIVSQRVGVERMRLVVYLFYPDRGVSFLSEGVFRERGREGGVVVFPTSPVTDINYFEPSSVEDFIDDYGRFTLITRLDQVHDWGGYNTLMPLE